MNISIDPAAAERLRDDLEGRLLRISFTTGCGGSGYRLASADEPATDDRTIELSGITVALDEMAASKLDGATIVWSDEEDGYIIDHPDAVAAVWCG